MLISEIELNKIYKQFVQVDVLPSTAINSIYLYIREKYPNARVSDLASYYAIPYTKESTKKGYLGRVSTQVSKYMRIANNINITGEDKGFIGNIASRYFEQGEQFSFKFIDEFNWKAGDFGDSGSCFWGGRERAREIMKEQHSWAIQLFNEEEKGIARCWFTRVEDGAIIWNGYGPSAWGDPLNKINNMLTAFLDMTSKRVTLLNNGSDSGIVYINGARGYAFGESFKEKSRYDFNWGGGCNTCSECGNEIWSEDDEYIFNDHVFCEECYNDMFRDCEECGRTLTENQVYYIDNVDLCENCYSKLCCTCDHCEEHIFIDSAVSVEREEFDETWCEHCYEHHSHQCEGCNDTIIDKNDEVCYKCKTEAVQTETIDVELKP